MRSNSALLFLLCLTKDACQAGLIVFCCPGRSSHTILVFETWIGPARQEEFCDFVMAKGAGPHQRCSSYLILNVWIRRPIKQHLDDLEATALAGAVKRRVAFR